MAECAAYIRAVRRFGDEPSAGVMLRARPGQYPFGMAREVVLMFDTDDEEACRYAQYCE